MMMPDFEFFDSLSEPSTWGGIGLIATGIFGLSLADWDVVQSLIMSVSGAIAWFLPGSERKTKRAARKS